jgi:phosphoribosylglycinamide formyltransferase-1
MRLEPCNRDIGILLSGRGSNFNAIADNIESGRLDARIAIVLSNKEDAPGLKEARRRGLKGVCLPSKGVSRAEFDRNAVELLGENGVALVCLAGFMRILGPTFMRAFPCRILNIHPSLLPAFPGLDAQSQALEYGVRLSGCTVHFVDASLDGGPIVGQAMVPVLDGDTVDDLSARILVEEHKLYSEAIGKVLSGRCEIHGRRVLTHD